MVGSILQLASTPEKKTQSDRIDQRLHKEVYSIVFAMPEQVGFCVLRISTDERYRDHLVELLKAEALVTKVQINITAASIVVIYKPGVMSDHQMRSHLIDLIQSDIDQPATIQPTNSYPTISQIENEQEQDKESLPILPASSYPAVTKQLHTTVIKETVIATFSRKQSPKSVDKQESPPAVLNGKNQRLHVTSQPNILPIPSQKIEPRAKQPKKVAYSIAHVIPGRIRFHVPRITKDPKYVQRLEALLQADPTVISERVNRTAGSIVITYKSAVKPKTKKADSSVLEAAISHLANLLQYASDVVAA